MSLPVFLVHLVPQLSISITHNKCPTTLLHLLINCISATSAVQKLFLKGKYILHFTDFLITGLCHSSANCWFSESELE